MSQSRNRPAGAGSGVAAGDPSRNRTRLAASPAVAPTYEIYGLRVRSEVRLSAAERRVVTPDLEIIQGARRPVPQGPPGGDLLAQLAHPGGGYTLARSGETYTLRFHGLCEFRFDVQRRRGEVDADPAAKPEMITLLLAGNGISSYLSARGEPPLHASAVEIAGGALAFAGAGGAGKSTLAALMCAHGARLITDDVLRVSRGPEIRCYYGSGELRLRENAASIAEGIAGGRRSRTVDHRIALSFDRPPEPAPLLRAVVLPRPSRSAAGLQVERLPRAGALLALARVPRIPIFHDRNTLAALFRVCHAVAENVPVFEAVVPWGPPFAPGIAAALLAQIGCA